MLSQQAAKELLIRRKARESSLHYANAIEVPGKPVSDDPDNEFFKPIETTMAAHHKLILESLDEISATPYGRLMLLLPPGSAKSTFASVVFPSMYLGQNPNKKIILASYGDELASKMGRRTRSIIKQPRYKGIFNTELSVESTAAQNFTLTNGSEYMSCGILGGITGNRANGIIIDDPIKGREQANSETIREKTYDAYKDDLSTRLIPGGWLVLIQTRWHEEDLAGRILPSDWKGQSGDILCKDGNVWKIICLPAKCEIEGDPLGRKVGDYLWPEWFDRKHWAQFESSPRTWASLFQQRPAPLDGDLFKPDQLKIVDAIPAEQIKWCRGWDLASTVDGDFTAGVKLGRLNDGRFIIGDVARFRYGVDQRDAALLNTTTLDGRSVTVSVPQDPGQAGKTQALYITRQLAGFKVKTSPETGDKVTRAEPVAAQINVGNVMMLRGDWNKAFMDELRIFPNGSNDDQVDALSRAFGEIMVTRKSFFG